MDSDCLHDVSVSEIDGLMQGRVDSVYGIITEGFSTAPVSLNHGKKKGKWKRWAKEGGQKEEVPEGFLLVDKKRAVNIVLEDDFAGS